ncbi:ABC transporter ATP-binding protein [Lederbergia galactosidilytica]|uniref:Peptide ABC transporter ATP-binding protein n=1 Tax=Lederbergia galactosidilytica TaxID=217031 RepID=A0A177ZNR1_9BACI|nr:ABC transporter ATP-binding protein [Lederbergia galactosidilytica]OAK68518.1 peptide ABC transporter ATP-binding protein [Lederbergia galactosidilytica]
MALLTVQDLTIRTQEQKLLVEKLSFIVAANSCLGIVGESGSGKSLSAKAIMGLLHPNLCVSGAVNFQGKELLQLPEEEMRKLRGRRICLILQDAMSAFVPLYTIGQQMTETLCEKLAVSKKEAIQISLQELDKMNIREPTQVVKKYPHQLSGGMLQRIMIALTIAVKPDLIIADEPTTALDPLNQSEVIKELQRLRKELKVAILFISHDLDIIRRIAEKVVVMRQGKQVEFGNVDAIFSTPKHEYTKYLVETREKITQSFRKALGRDPV